MAVVVHALTNQQAEASQDQLVPIYRDAFSLPPYCKEEAEVVDFAQSFPQHLQKEGFRIVVAWEDRTQQVVGFAYGLANRPDQVWYEEVAKAAPPWMVTEWLTGSFRLVEMAVTPEAQRQGIGGLLHDHLLSGLSYPKAVLSTMAASTAAYRLYRRRGWRVLLDDLSFPGVARPYRIMGLELGRENAR
ncbi:MAG TPA: GNAT family N-acetyltransferase [Anaerolineae bacterium]|nr:GNAT family N-acetyltransferase [Anaerolineae bacterium]